MEPKYISTASVRDLCLFIRGTGLLTGPKEEEGEEEEEEEEEEEDLNSLFKF
jgi:hypothetical protein